MVRKQQPPIQPEVKETPQPRKDAFTPLDEGEAEDRAAAEDATNNDDTRPRAPRRENQVLKNGHVVWEGNDVRFTGNLGRDPELSVTSNGNAYTIISLAVSQGKDKDAMWLRGICWAELAEAVERDYRKGDRVRIYGHLSQRKWENRDGIMVTTDEVVFDVLEYIEPRR